LNSLICEEHQGDAECCNRGDGKTREYACDDWTEHVLERRSEEDGERLPTEQRRHPQDEGETECGEVFHAVL
jgi:hypothetical protein